VVADEADPTLALMVRGKKIREEAIREELFSMNIQVKQNLVKAIMDPGSQKNLISEDLVREMGLETTPHFRPYRVEWGKRGHEVRVNRQCVLKFAVSKAYMDEVICDVVPLDVGQVIFGSSYIYGRDGVYYRRVQKHKFVKDGKEVFLKNVKDAPPA
jgi:hypothetical protein